MTDGVAPADDGVVEATHHADGKTPGLRADDPWAEAGRNVLRFHLGRMRARVPGVIAGQDIEEVHATRVAARRMRAGQAIARLCAAGTVSEEEVHGGETFAMELPPPSGGSLSAQARALAEGVAAGDTNAWALGIGLLSLAIILGLMRLSPRTPGILIAVVASIAISIVLHLAARGVAGIVRQGLLETIDLGHVHQSVTEAVKAIRREQEAAGPAAARQPCSAADIFASPERRLVFDAQRHRRDAAGPLGAGRQALAASIVIAGRANGFTPARSRAATMATVRAFLEGRDEDDLLILQGKEATRRSWRSTWAAAATPTTASVSWSATA